MRNGGDDRKHLSEKEVEKESGEMIDGGSGIHGLGWSLGRLVLMIRGYSHH